MNRSYLEEMIEDKIKTAIEDLDILIGDDEKLKILAREKFKSIKRCFVCWRKSETEICDYCSHSINI